MRPWPILLNHTADSNVSDFYTNSVTSNYQIFNIFHDDTNQLIFCLGEEPKNFTKRNMRKIREIQNESKRRQDERSKPVKPVQLPDKYSHVPAKVTAHIHVC